MIVFGVCTLGVVSLYLVPSVAGSPSPVAMPQTANEPEPRTSGRATVRVPQAGATGIGQPVDTTLPLPEPTQRPDRPTSRSRPTSPPGAAAQPTERAGRPSTPPTPPTPSRPLR